MMEKKTIDRRVKRSRKLMQDALLRLLQTMDYWKISVSLITKEADVARTTFYSHFQSKDELLLSYIDDIFENFFTRLQEQYPHPNRSELEHEIPLILLEEWKSNKDTLDLIRSANMDYLIFRRIRENHVTATSDEAIRVLGASSNPVVESYIASFISGATCAVLMQWTDSGMQEPAEAVAKLLFRLIQRPHLNDIRRQFDANLEGM